MNKNILISIFVLLVIFFLGVVVVKSLNQKSATMNVDSSPTSTQSPTKMGDKGSEVREIIVSGSNYKFDPSEIKVKKGERVKIIFKNSGGVHDFVIDEFNVRTQVIGSEKEDTVEFVPDKTGTFEYYCSVGNHRQMGMVGNLIVE